jgi:ACS family hexuronate transporter-like MFS transporter
MAGLLFLSTVINYLHRQILSVLAPVLREEFHLTNTQYGYAVNSFLIAYGIMFAVSGWLVDVLNTRRALALSFTLWSIASLCHSFVVGLWDLCFYRFLLGASEPANFTAFVKGISSWFPSRERGLAVGFVGGGTAIGAVLAPPLVIWLAQHWGWRAAFLIPSLAGLIWLPLWLWIFREPRDHRWLTESERLYIESDRQGVAEMAAAPRPKWSSMFAQRQTWSFILARFFFDPLGYFYWFWLPSFLVTAKGFTLEALGKWLWIPYLSLDAGQMAGGYFSGALIRRGVAPILARKIGMTIPVVMAPVALLSLKASEISWILLFVGIASFGLGWWGANYNAAVMDTVPSASMASVNGVAMSAGLASSSIFTWLTGHAADHHAYHFIFWANSSLMCMAVGAFWLLLHEPMPHSRR